MSVSTQFITTEIKSKMPCDKEGFVIDFDNGSVFLIYFRIINLYASLNE